MNTMSIWKNSYVLKKLIISEELNLTDESIIILSNDTTIYIVKSDLIDEEEEKLLKEKLKLSLEKEISRCESILNNEKFLQKSS